MSYTLSNKQWLFLLQAFLLGTTGLADVAAQEAPPAAGNTVASSPSLTTSRFIRDAHLNLALRNYADYLDLNQLGRRHAWIQAVRANFESGYTEGALGVGFDASLFAALKLDGGTGASNMVHLDRKGGGQNQLGWAYPGTYAFKAKIADTVFKYGMHVVSNPFLEPYDIRSLPPSFRGMTLVSKVADSVTVEAGSFNAVNARGRTYLQSLSTAYGRTAFDRLDYLGGNWEYQSNGKFALYASQAQDVWNQYYASLNHSIGSPATVKWSGGANAYVTRNQGRSLQGQIDNKAYSVSLSAQHQASSVMVAYQRMLGNQFMDFTRETSGIYLANSMGSDYNAPHEQSLQIRYNLNGNLMGAPGWQFSIWRIDGWGVDASSEAAKYAAANSQLHNLYWMAGQPLRGGHHEIGINPSYVVQSGTLKNAKISLLAISHKGGTYYPDQNFTEYRITINMPYSVF